MANHPTNLFASPKTNPFASLASGIVPKKKPPTSPKFGPSRPTGTLQPGVFGPLAPGQGRAAGPIQAPPPVQGPVRPPPTVAAPVAPQPTSQTVDL